MNSKNSFRKQFQKSIPLISRFRFAETADQCNLLKPGMYNLIILPVLFTLSLIPATSFAEITNGFEPEGNATDVNITQPQEMELSIQKTNILCYGENTGSITVNASGGTPPYQFAINAGSFSPDNVFGNLTASTYTIHVKDAGSCKKSIDVTVTQPPLLSCSLSKPDHLPVCGSVNNQLIATTENAVTYKWTVIGNGWIITDGQGTYKITYTAGKDDATFILIVTDDKGCVDASQVTFGSGTCVKVAPFCTLTQGFYGEIKGIACATGTNATDLIPSLLNASFGDLVIGKAGRSLTITQSSAYCVIQRMSGGGRAAVLPAGNQSFDSNCNTTISLNQNGRFNNTLLGQTIALGFNLRLDSDLGSLVIPGTTFTTMGALPGIDGICGTEDDVPVFESQISKTIPQAVINALISIYSGATVENLFDLANRALGGQSTGRATLNDINQAVSAVNEGFDGCRFLVLPEQPLFQEPISMDGITRDIMMKAFPNPFLNSTTIEFVAGTDMNVVVSVYTLSGFKVTELFNSNLKANETRQVIFSGESLPDGIYIYKIPVGDKVYFDRLVLQK